MGKLLPALLFLFAFHAALYLSFGAGMPGNAFYELITGQLASWDSNLLINYIISDVLSIVGLSAITIGTIAWKQDWIIYFGIALTFFGFGKGYIDAYTLLQTSGFLTNDLTRYVLLLMFGMVIISWIVLILEFGRGRD